MICGSSEAGNSGSPRDRVPPAVAAAGAELDADEAAGAAEEAGAEEEAGEAAEAGAALLAVLAAGDGDAEDGLGELDAGAAGELCVEVDSPHAANARLTVPAAL